MFVSLFVSDGRKFLLVEFVYAAQFGNPKHNVRLSNVPNVFNGFILIVYV